MTKRFVFYRDVEMSEGWPEKIRHAQTVTTYVIGGRQYPRIRFGRERPRAPDKLTCHDCAVVPGEFHVPGCDVERCPACHGQAIACDCDEEARV
jgi:hypothetical protein